MQLDIFDEREHGLKQTSMNHWNFLFEWVVPTYGPEQTRELIELEGYNGC